MTIDEKIQDFRQLEYDFEHCMCDTEDDKENLMKYQQEYEYYEQLAEWLEELKMLRELKDEHRKIGNIEGYNDGYKKAIDDFVKEICKMIVQSENNGNYRFYAVEIKQAIADLAEQLKAGGTDE